LGQIALEPNAEFILQYADDFTLAIGTFVSAIDCHFSFQKSDPSFRQTSFDQLDVVYRLFLPYLTPWLL